jgi:hypothetical protein
MIMIVREFSLEMPFGLTSMAACRFQFRIRKLAEFSAADVSARRTDDGCRNVTLGTPSRGSDPNAYRAIIVFASGSGLSGSAA